MHAVEHGRNLHIHLGEEGEPGAARIVIKPIGAKRGAALWALWSGIAFGQAEDAEADAARMGALAVGEEHWDLIEGEPVEIDGEIVELRWAESEAIIHAAFFWNVRGGGLDLVNTLLEQNGAQGGYPKAHALLLERNGLSTAFGQLKTLLSGDEESATPELDASNATSTPNGSAT